MHRWLILLLLVPTAAATVADDPVGDHGSSFRASAMDLHSLAITEDEEAFHFTVEHAPADDPPMQYLDDIIYTFHVDADGSDYVIQAVRYSRPVTPLAYGMSAGVYEGSEVDFTARTASLDVTDHGDGFEFSVDRTLLAGSAGVPLTSGQTLDVWMEAWTMEPLLGTDMRDHRGVDRLPDDGAVSFDVAIGLPQDGLRLHTPEPLRWSNGEATTYAYNLELWSEDGEQDVTWSVDGLPPAWRIALPDLDRIGAAPQPVQVRVSVPFAHQHGVTETFALTAEGTAGRAGIELGVHYPAVAQPSGHHPTLHIHTAPGEPYELDTVLQVLGSSEARRTYMNTLEDDPDSDGEGAPALFDGCGNDDCTEMRFRWNVPLVPGLAMGLAHEPGNEGTARIDLSAAVPVDARMRGELIVTQATVNPFRDRIEGTVIAAFDAQTSTDGSVEAPIVWGDDDRVPYDARNQLWLAITIDTAPTLVSQTPATPVLMSGRLDLPLQEYHDGVASVHEAVPETATDEEAPTQVETPAVALPALLGCVALAGWRRRR